MKSLVFTKRVYDLPYESLDQTSAYIDLRSDPARIDEIPELKWEPRLKPLVAVLNDPPAPFMTHGCAVGSRTPGIVGSTVIPFPKTARSAAYWYSSYVIFSLWSLSQNKEEYYKDIYKSYPDTNSECNVCFEIEPAYFVTPYERSLGRKWTETNGMVCGLWISGWGNTSAEAEEKWSSCIDDTVAFFASAMSNLPQPAGDTLSKHMFG
jgi:hypothetical protein